MANDLQVINGFDQDEGVTIEHGEALPDSDAALAQVVDVLPVSKLPPAEQFRILSGWWRADADFSHEWRAQAKMWFEFRAGEHWTAEDKALLDSRQRPHIVFNRVLTILKAVAGMEINGRHEEAFLPRGVEDTAANEVLSAASKWMSDECDGEDEESEAFDDTCTCGMGWTEDRMSYEDDPAGLWDQQQVDPLEMYWDRACKKRNLKNARRMSRVRRMPLSDAASMFPGKNRQELDATWAIDGTLDYPQKSLEQKWKRDENNTLDPTYDDLSEVTIVHMQWIEREVYWIVADLQTNTKAELTDRQYKIFAERMKQLGMEVDAARMTRKVYKQAFLGGDGSMLRPASDAPIAGQFSWKVITGEKDAKGTWFGLVKVMRDPQMWANKWLSQILHILNTTAKGGILAERSAFDDERDAEESYAQSDQITWLSDGSLSGDKPKVMPKPGQGSIDGYVGLLTFAVSSIKDVVGINLELLGQQDQNQPGILEAMRKQAGMTVLATLFNSLRHFRKQIGNSKLYFIQNFLSDDRLIRVAGPEGASAVKLSKEKTTGQYDVVVDDTPTSPNQKEANWQIIQPLLAVFKDQLMAQPQVFAVLLEYSPLPSRIVETIKGLINQQQNDPQAQMERQQDRQLLVDATVAKTMKDQSAAELNMAKAKTSEATAIYDIAMARNMMEDNMRQGRFEEAKQNIETIKLLSEAESKRADGIRAHADAEHRLATAEHLRARAERERTGAFTDVMDARERTGTERVKQQREAVGAVIDKLTGIAKADRDRAAAEKDRAIAKRPAPQQA